MSEPEVSFHVPMLCEVLDRLAHEIRDARKVASAQLEWFKSQPSGNGDFTDLQKKRFAELLFSIEGAINRAVKPEVRFWSIGFDQDEPIPKESNETNKTS